jgi:8-oxo-dGTP diphosphatase
MPGFTDAVFPANIGNSRRRTEGRNKLLLFLLFLIFVFVRVIIVFFDRLGVFLFVFLIIVQIIGDGIEADRVRLNDLQLRFAFGTAEDLSLFHFVFVHINFGGTIRAANHGCVLLEELPRARSRNRRPAPTGVLYTVAGKGIFRKQRLSARSNAARSSGGELTTTREFPERPVVGVGGVVIESARVLLIRRGAEPLRGEWSIPGGALELGESLAQGVARELREETGLEVRLLELIEVFDRIFYAQDGKLVSAPVGSVAKPRYHYVIADYLCERAGGEPRAGSDVTDLAFALEEELPQFHLTETATRVIRKAFALSRARAAEK